VLLGDDRHDVVIDENLSLGEVLLLCGVSEDDQAAAVSAVASGGVIYPLDQTVAQARLAAGSVLTPVRADAMARLDRSTIGRRRRVTGIPAWGPAALDSSGTRAVAPTAVIPTADVASVLAAANDPGAGSSRADMAARMPSVPVPALGASGDRSAPPSSGRETAASTSTTAGSFQRGDSRALAAGAGGLRTPIETARELAAPLLVSCVVS